LCASHFNFVGKDTPPWFTKFELEKFFSLFYIISTQRSYIYIKNRIQIGVLRNWEQFQICSVFFYTPCSDLFSFCFIYFTYFKNDRSETEFACDGDLNVNKVCEQGINIVNLNIPLKWFFKNIIFSEECFNICRTESIF
jgi:hypothetical protein